MMKVFSIMNITTAAAKIISHFTVQEAAASCKVVSIICNNNPNTAYILNQRQYVGNKQWQI
jgi:hypothetical protein